MGVRVGIGVPVYNGASLLHESLECLRNQHFENFEVIIADNASTDETEEICAEFVSKDNRFRYFRNAENIGLLNNYVKLREATEAPLFMWRAYDDLSAPNYITELISLFDSDPKTQLAVAHVDSRSIIKGTQRDYPYQPCSKENGAFGLVSQLLTSHASWFYGLWDRKTLAREQDRTYAVYQYPWAVDHLILFPMILDGTIRGTNQTRFIQRETAQSHQRPDTTILHPLHLAFVNKCRADISARNWSISERALLEVILPRYYDIRTGHRSWKRSLRSLFFRHLYKR